MVSQEGGQGKQFQALLKDIEEASLEGGALDKACNQLQELVSGLQPPPQLVKDISKCDQTPPPPHLPPAQTPTGSVSLHPYPNYATM